MLEEHRPSRHWSEVLIVGVLVFLAVLFFAFAAKGCAGTFAPTTQNDPAVTEKLDSIDRSVQLLLNSQDATRQAEMDRRYGLDETPTVEPTKTP